MARFDNFDNFFFLSVVFFNAGDRLSGLSVKRVFPLFRVGVTAFIVLLYIVSAVVISKLLLL